MSDSSDFAKLLEGCDDLEPLLALLGKTSGTLSDADRIRLLRVIMAFLGVCLKVDLKITV
ncbi:hypothetical protein [Dehalobacterium formicoaceticum]|uniref:Uncharacterized protein n=1 Tax=Dehalobacterium formicoaceticum TaxID=51515 RepID=A0ABT1Y6S9_9FIRM|nr:hypothetical protein [Dehalobacterium formicoaceticum]MCR6545619.1 hypothetical protein [Dehalobacterium formicoaceticum]